MIRLRRMSALLRAVLALLLVCAQVFAAAHAMGHLADLAIQLRHEPGAGVTPDPGSLPDTVHHGHCLQCLASACLGSGLPAATFLLTAGLPIQLLPVAVLPVTRAVRLPRPHSRGPPLSPA